jgi:hypothetical protein
LRFCLDFSVRGLGVAAVCDRGSLKRSQGAFPSVQTFEKRKREREREEKEREREGKMVSQTHVVSKEPLGIFFRF